MHQEITDKGIKNIMENTDVFNYYLLKYPVTVERQTQCSFSLCYTHVKC